MKKYAKIINQETKECEVGIGTNISYYQSLGMAETDVEQAWNGAWYIKGYAPSKPAPTHEEVQQTRARLYQEQVDPITSHISRLRDSEGHEEEIADLISERDALVEKIKEENPYPDELS